MNWLKRLFGCSKKKTEQKSSVTEELKEKTKTLSSESDARILVESGEENSAFACILQTAIKYEYLNPGKLVTRFIENHLNREANDEEMYMSHYKLEPTEGINDMFMAHYKLEPTEEIKELCSKLYFYKAKVYNDHALESFIEENSK